MLEPAILHKDAINRLMAISTLDPYYKFFHVSEDVVLTIEINNSNWTSHQFVSIGEGQEVLGYMAATVNRTVRSVTNLAVISFKKRNLTFIRDFQRFMWRLFVHHNYIKVRWSVVCGSPNEAAYDRMCKKYGGRIVGIFEKENRLEDGELYNEKHYEIMNGDFVKKALPTAAYLQDTGRGIPEYSNETN